MFYIISSIVRDQPHANYLLELETKGTTEPHIHFVLVDISIFRHSRSLEHLIALQTRRLQLYETNFPFLNCKIPTSFARGIFIFDYVVRHGMFKVWRFCDWNRTTCSKLVTRDYVIQCIKSILMKYFGRYGDLIQHIGSLLTNNQRLSGLRLSSHFANSRQPSYNYLYILYVYVHRENRLIWSVLLKLVAYK